LQLDFFERRILARRLIEMSVNANVAIRHVRGFSETGVR
jgi:hypothetical protein